MKRVSSTRMKQIVQPKTFSRCLRAALLLTGTWLTSAGGATIAPSPYWKNQIVFPYDSFCPRSIKEGVVTGGVTWVKFTILLEPYDPNVVYFQDSRKYVFHYTFAAEQLEPFLGMSTQQFNAVTLFEKDQQAILGTVILPPATTFRYQEPQFPEYGIQFVRQDPFTPEQIRDLFRLVKSRVAAPPDVQAFYFPTYEQQATASANRDWFEAQGVPLSSTARWAKGNTAYSEGWALGKLEFVSGDKIADFYHRGLLEPNNILLTDGVPAEVPFVAGILSLAPSTPNSHVAILARTYAVPFAHLAVADDANYAQQLVGHRILLSAYDDLNGTQTKLVDTEDLLDEATVAQILQLKKPAPLSLSPTVPYGSFGIPTMGLLPSDIQYVGGKASNFGILQRAVPENSPKALALTFDLWNAFLDQPLAPSRPIVLGPGEHILFWADDDEEQGPTHTSFKLSRGGESIALFNVDGFTPLDVVHFGPQSRNVSSGRSVDGDDTWQSFDVPTPGQPNSANPGAKPGRLVINEFMADNTNVIQDPCESGDWADWIELYNGSDDIIVLNGMYLTDDVNDPTKWQIRPEVQAPTLREEIARRLSKYGSYPPRDMQMLSRDLASVRSLFTNPGVVPFGDELREGVIAVLTDPAYDIDPNAKLRFRSSTNVEDSADFIGAGLYDSFSGCLADELDDDDSGPCACDPNRSNERGVFRAVRRVFASFYNDNAWLERLRHDVNEAEVGMAVLVHPSFPDEIELANGVATLEKSGADADTHITLVTQQSAVSVTNPEDGSIPEEVTVAILPSGSVVPPRLIQPSSLIPLGGTVMTWPKDYTDLTDLLVRIGDMFTALTGKAACILDLEYKKVAPGGAVLPPGGLVVKQVREIPTSDRMQTPFLINQPMEFEVFTGEVEIFEATDVFADHRLKSRWKLETRNVILDSNALAESLYANVQIEYLDGDRIGTVAQEMAFLPFAEHSFDAKGTTDSWRLDDLGNPRTYRLWTTNIPTAVPPAQRPVFTLADFGREGYNIPFKCLMIDVEYDQPVISWHQQVFPGDPPSDLGRTTHSRVYLWPHMPPSDDDVPQERTFSANGISLKISFYYPPLPPGMANWGFLGGNTGPLKRWDRTIIEGLTSEPIVLRGYYSQTFRPEHHNLIEHFLFEPRLEPGISDAILTELRTRDVRFIHLILDNVYEDGDQSQIQTHGFDKPS